MNRHILRPNKRTIKRHQTKKFARLMMFLKHYAISLNSTTLIKTFIHCASSRISCLGTPASIPNKLSAISIHISLTISQNINSFTSYLLLGSAHVVIDTFVHLHAITLISQKIVCVLAVIIAASYPTFYFVTTDNYTYLLYLFNKYYNSFFMLIYFFILFLKNWFSFLFFFISQV